MARRFKPENIVAWGLSVKDLTKSQCDKLMLEAVKMGGAVVVRPQVKKAVKE